jgi:hypothetical protein
MFAGIFQMLADFQAKLVGGVNYIREKLGFEPDPGLAVRRQLGGRRGGNAGQMKAAAARIASRKSKPRAIESLTQPKAASTTRQAKRKQARTGRPRSARRLSGLLDHVGLFVAAAGHCSRRFHAGHVQRRGRRTARDARVPTRRPNARPTRPRRWKNTWPRSARHRRGRLGVRMSLTVYEKGRFAPSQIRQRDDEQRFVDRVHLRGARDHERDRRRQRGARGRALGLLGQLRRSPRAAGGHPDAHGSRFVGGHGPLRHRGRTEEPATAPARHVALQLRHFGRHSQDHSVAADALARRAQPSTQRPICWERSTTTARRSRASRSWCRNWSSASRRITRRRR